MGKNRRKNKKMNIDLRAMRWVFACVLVVGMAVLLPIALQKCQPPPSEEPPAHASLFTAHLQQAFAEQSMEYRDNEIYDLVYERSVASLETTTEGALLVSGRLQIPYLLFDGAPDPESDWEFNLFIQAEESQHIIERAAHTLYAFADTGAAPPEPASDALLFEISEVMRSGKAYNWTWNMLQFTAEKKMDLAGNTVLVIAFSVPLETPAPQE